MISGDESQVHVEIQRALARGDMFRVFELAREGLIEWPDDPQFRFLQTLSLARLGEPYAAIRSYDRNRIAEIATEDAIALKARLLKDLALRAGPAEQADLFRQSSETYHQASVLDDGYFSSINEATTAFLAGDRDRAVALADMIVRRPEIVAAADYFAAATLGEAHLLRGKYADAVDAFKEARRLPDANPGGLASTTRQIGIIVAQIPIAADQKEHILAAIRPAPILHFCGHMFSALWSGARALESQIASALDETGSSIAYGSLACGADMMIAEAVIERGGEVHIVLPFAEDDFLETSVKKGGKDWLPRYDHVRAQAASVTFATQMPFVNDDHQFAYCSKLAMGTVRLRAKTMQTHAVQLAIWDGVPAASLAGTAADVSEWRSQNGINKTIAVAPDRPSLEQMRPKIVAEQTARKLGAIIFADFSGFSKLSERQLPGFLNFVMGAVGTVLGKHGDSVLCRNSWGDAIYCVIETPVKAALIALEIQSALDPVLLQKAGLPEEGGMRISLHCGPIYEDYDPIQQGRTYYGTEVTLAARIEPRVPVGSIYTTQQFAALIDAKDAHLFQFEYVGTMELAKDYGKRVLYRLTQPLSHTSSERFCE